jgi:phage terminase small subunit
LERERDRDLTDKQRLFVAEYLVDLNATQAAVRAGYAAKTARVIAAQNLSKLNIREAVDKALAERQGRVQISADRVLREVAILAFSDLGQVLDFAGDRLSLKPPSQIPESARRALASVKVRRYVEGAGDLAREVELIEFRLHPKVEALRDLAKHLGILREGHDVNLSGAANHVHLTDDQRDRAIAAVLARLGFRPPDPGGNGSDQPAGSTRQLVKAPDPPDAPGAEVPPAVIQAFTRGPAEPGPGDRYLQQDDPLDLTAVPADDVQGRPVGLAGRTQPDGRRAAPGLGGKQAGPLDARQVVGRGGVV